MFPLNMVFASTSGDIGYHMTGLFPKRKFNVGQGVYPKKGWLKDNLWEGLIPPEEHPRLYNPESGLIVTANKDCKLTIKDMIDGQLDTLDIQARAST
jgi:penicillin amidase